MAPVAAAAGPRYKTPNRRWAANSRKNTRRLAHLPKFAANLSLLFTEVPFLDRFEAAAQAGFRGVEFLFPYAFEPAAIRERLQASALEQTLFNFPCGDWEGGERGFAAISGRETDFDASLALGITYARAIGVPRMHLMAGILPAGTSPQSAADVYAKNVATAARACAEHGIDVMLEPLNSLDVPGYFLRTIPQALAIIDRVGEPNVFLQLDLYHAQISEGDLARKITDLAGRYTHVQIAGNRGATNPTSGKSTIRICSKRWTLPVTTVGSVASTARAPAHLKV